ncbi:MAG: hypothetical protein MUE31_07050 [Candidatus Nanopelagicales bacterium]|jgi:phosphoglycerate dehydrogenase-like enzyme|nr:hypothetical protein [Candidatus Nanopelagicales bacterium]
MTVVLMPRWLAPPALPGVEYLWWDQGEPEPPQHDLDRVEVFVAPYMPEPADLWIAWRMPKLTRVVSLMAGVDGLVPHLPPVPVERAVGLHDTSTAELAVGLMIAAQRGIDTAARDMTPGRWAHTRRPSLADSAVGLVGFGGVGRAIAARLEPFEVKLTAFSRSGRDCLPVSQFDVHLPTFDIVVLALPGQPGPAFMSAERLAAMRDGALLVNVGRGTLVDTEALVLQTTAGRLRAALDVTDPEPLPPDHPLWTCPGALVTPHVGGDSQAFLPRARALIAARMRALGAD